MQLAVNKDPTLELGTVSDMIRFSPVNGTLLSALKFHIMFQDINHTGDSIQVRFSPCVLSKSNNMSDSKALIFLYLNLQDGSKKM